MTDTTPPFSECDDVTDDSALVQGDVFEWLERKDDPWLQFGVIVTANCDILHQKHRGILSYVPVLAIEDYLRIFFFPSVLRKGVKSIAEQLGRTLLADEVADAIRAYQAENFPDFPEPLADSVALQWALTLTPDGLADELRITDAGPRNKFVTLVEDFRAVEAAVTGETYAAQWNALIRLRVRQGAAAEKAREKIWSDIRASMKDLAGDRFFLGRLGSVPGDGWIAYLRLVREIQQIRWRSGSPTSARRRRWPSVSLAFDLRTSTDSLNSQLTYLPQLDSPRRLAQLPCEPRLCEFPVTHDGLRRHIEDFRGLLDAEAAKVPKLDNLRPSRIQARKRLQGIVQRAQCRRALRLCRGQFIEVQFDAVYPLVRAAAFGRAGFPRVVDENAPHTARRQCEKVRAIAPSDRPDLDQL